MKKGICMLAVAIIGATFGATAYTQTAALPAASAPAQPRELHVAVLVAPPFVVDQNGSLTGFNIDLWNAIAAQMSVKTNYETMPDVESILEAMRSKRVDIVAAPVVVTAAREEEFDFSLPIMQAGLQIMMRDSGEMEAPNPFQDVVDLLFSKTALNWLGIALILVLVPGHLVWLFERRREDGIIKNRSYIPGIFEATYWAISCLATQAENMPHQWLARTFSIFWMFVGVVFVAFYTAQLTTTLTVRQIHGSISGPDDLPGKRVATIANSTAADYLHAHNVKVQEFPRVDPMFQALQSKSVDATVFTSPVLRYYAAHEGKGVVRLVGPEFDVLQISFLLRSNSSLLRKVNVALLNLRENGTYQQIYDKWFGTP